MQAVLSDEHTLALFSQDFGKIISSSPVAVFSPDHIELLQTFIKYASKNKLPVTIRGMGLSQGGQSIPIEGGITLTMQHFIKTHKIVDNSIWVEANARWCDILDRTLPYQLAPAVLPYNCNLPIAGVLSAGGIGSSSFKNSTITTQVQALEVIDGRGEKRIVDEQSPLFEACLGGQGRCAVISKACIRLNPVSPQVKSYFLVYNDMEQWFQDIETAKEHADYLELFCSPSPQGAALYGDDRKPIADWLYGMHVSYGFKQKSPGLKGSLKPQKILHSHEESIRSYFLRHNGRFTAMKETGQWDMIHPWYECFLPESIIKNKLAEILKQLPLYYANLVHIVPIAKPSVGYTMFPDSESIYELMILNPGIPAPLKQGSLQTIHALDEQLLMMNGKRYLSGYLGHPVNEDYWKRHYGSRYDQWIHLKKEYDPFSIFTSSLFQ